MSAGTMSSLYLTSKINIHKQLILRIYMYKFFVYIATYKVCTLGLH